jgi:hypothetical protein
VSLPGPGKMGSRKVGKTFLSPSRKKKSANRRNA